MQRRSFLCLLAGAAFVAGGLFTAMSSLQIVLQTTSGSSLSDSTINYDVLRYDPWLVLVSVLLMILAGFALYRAGRYNSRPRGRRPRRVSPGSAIATRAAGLMAGGLLLLWSIAWALGALALAGATFSVGSSPPDGHLVLVPLGAAGAIATAVVGSACVYLSGQVGHPSEAVGVAAGRV